MNKVWMVLFLLLLPSYGFAEDNDEQSGQLLGGVTAGTGLFRYAGKGISGPSVSTPGKLGWVIGGSLDYDLHPMVGIHAELLWARKGSHQDVIGIGRASYINDYIDLPILARVTLPLPLSSGGKVRPIVLAGASVSWLLRAKGTEDFGSDVYEDMKYAYADTDGGLLMGAGATVQLAGNHRLDVEARYYLGLLDIHDLAADPERVIHNRAVMLMVRWQTRVFSRGRR